MRNLKYYFSKRIKTTENYKHFLLKKNLCSLKNKNNSYGDKCTISYSDDSFYVNRCFKNIIEEYFLCYTGLSKNVYILKDGKLNYSQNYIILTY